MHKLALKEQCVSVCAFFSAFYSQRQLIGRVAGGSGSCLNAHIINVEGHTHTHKPSLSVSIWRRSLGLMRGGVWQCVLKAN